MPSLPNFSLLGAKKTKYLGPFLKSQTFTALKYTHILCIPQGAVSCLYASWASSNHQNTQWLFEIGSHKTDSHTRCDPPPLYPPPPNTHTYTNTQLSVSQSVPLQVSCPNFTRTRPLSTVLFTQAHILWAKPGE